MTFTERRHRFRSVLEGNACVFPASVFDPMSARAAEELGYELGMFSGSIASYAVLGAPDIILLTLSELADQSLRINRATSLPLLVDADHGYGNALNVMRTIQELEIVGVAAASIEDTVLPKAHGETKPGLISIEEGVGKMRAALAARTDKEFVVVGRTSAQYLSNTQDAIRRAKAYIAEGIDAMFFAGPMQREQLEEITSAISIPIIYAGPPGPLVDREYLGGLGVRVALQSHQPFSAAVQAVYDALKALRNGTAPADLKGVASAELMDQLSRNGPYKDYSRRFLGS